MDQTIVQLLLVLILILTVVIPMIIHATILPVIHMTGKVMIIVMMKTTIADVNGMQETVVVVMLTLNIVQLVNV